MPERRSTEPFFERRDTTLVSLFSLFACSRFLKSLTLLSIFPEGPLSTYVAGNKHTRTGSNIPTFGAPTGFFTAVNVLTVPALTALDFTIRLVRIDKSIISTEMPLYCQYTLRASDVKSRRHRRVLSFLCGCQL